MHVVYGLVGLKTHAKICLVVAPRSERHPPLLPRRHGQLQPEHRARSTRTSACFTADPELGADLSELFNHLTGYSRPAEYRTPARRARRHCASGLLELIRERGRSRRRPDRDQDEQARRPGADRRALRGVAGGRADRSRSSRGICCLRPGVPGLSETIRVRSIVGPLPRALPRSSASAARAEAPSTSSARPT